VIEPAGGQLHGPGLERFHGSCDSPRYRECAQRGQHERERGKDAETDEACVQRREGLRERLFDDHCPPKRRNRGGCRNHVLPGVTLREQCAIVCADLDEVREIAVLQHELQVGMGDKPSTAIDDVGVARAPDFDARHAVPHEFQVDIGQRDRLCPQARG
jgi:hypothetical protein